MQATFDPMEFVRLFPSIVEKAAVSPLGIIALIVFAASLVIMFLFRGEGAMVKAASQGIPGDREPENQGVWVTVPAMTRVRNGGDRTAGKAR